MRKHLIFTIFMVVSMVASAQTDSINSNTKKYNDWGAFRLSLNQMNLNPGNDLKKMFFNDELEELSTLNGFSCELKGNAHIGRTPLCFQFGAGFMINTSRYEKSEGDISMEAKVRYFSYYNPLNLAYELSLSDNVLIVPYWGIRFDISIGRYKTEITADNKTNVYEFCMIDNDMDINSLEIEKQWGKAPFEGNMFNLGWQMGIDLKFDGFLLGFNYITDLNYRMKGTKSSIMQFTIGFVFLK